MEYLGKNSLGRKPGRGGEYRKIVLDAEKKCVWAEAGVAPYKLCNFHFDCTNCAFDIAMSGRKEFTPRMMHSRGGKLCPHRFYHHCHTWARVEQKAFVRVGLDDFGQNVLGPIEKVRLPLRNKKIEKKSMQVMARGLIIPLVSPVEGYVEEINEELVNQPKLANTFPYENGWFVLLRPISLVKNIKPPTW